jgi:hypothetical protein
MRFLQLNGFTVRGDRQVDFQRWVTENEGRIKAAYPPGSEYGGIYAAVFSSEKEVGEYFWIDILDSYAALDRSAADARDPDSAIATINAELNEFFEPDRHAPWSKILLKSVVDATVMDLPVG